MRIKNLISFAFLLLLGTCLAPPSAYCREKPLVRFGVNLRFHPITMYERYQPLMDYLTQNTPYRFELKISRDYTETLRFLAEGKVDICSVGDGALMKAMLQHGAVPIVKPLNDRGRPYYRSCFVVRADSPLRSLQELRGKKVAFGYKHSTTGNMIPRMVLFKNGITVEQLGSVTNLRHHGAVARAVLKGEFDAGVVKEATALRYQKKGVRVLACSEELPSIPLIMRRGAPSELSAAIQSALVKLNRADPKDRKIMSSLDLEYRNGFVPATAADYRELTTRFKTFPLGCSAGCH